MYIMARGIIGFGLPYAIVAGSCLIGELGKYPLMNNSFISNVHDADPNKDIPKKDRS